MTTRTFARTAWTPAQFNDASNMSDGGYMGLQGGGSVNMLFVSEVYMGGLATVQSPMNMIFARDSTVGVTLAQGTSTDASDNPSASALTGGPVSFCNATTKPQRSSTLVLLAPAINGFGGISRWTALEPDGRKTLVGNTASAGEMSLSCGPSSTPGLMSSHIIYEPV